MTNDDDRPLGSRARDNTPASLAQARAEAVALPGPQSDAKGRNGVSRYHEFELDYYDALRDRKWIGKFKCHVATVRDQIAIGRIMAQLRGNTPPQSLDPVTLQLTEMLAQLTVVLDEVPDWAKKDALMDLHDGGVLGTIYKEVRDHEARFWGTDAASKDAGNAGEPGA